MQKKPPPFFSSTGYIEPAGHTGKWRVSEQGKLVSGAKSPRFTRKSIEDALAGLRDRMRAVNDDPDAAYRLTDAVAFGDFLGEASRVQAPEVGIRLIPKSDTSAMPSAKQHAAELNFLKQLRGKTALLHVVPYEDWMSSRSHVRLCEEDSENGRLQDSDGKKWVWNRKAVLSVTSRYRETLSSQSLPFRGKRPCRTDGLDRTTLMAQRWYICVCSVRSIGQKAALCESSMLL